MLEEILGDNIALIIKLLPVEIIVFLVVVATLYKTGTLERSAKTLNAWLASIINAEKSRKDFEHQKELLESTHDANIERVQVESILQNRAKYDLENQRLRHQLFTLTENHIKFLESELKTQNDFLRTLIETFSKPV